MQTSSRERQGTGSASPDPPQQIGPYQVLARIGEGGMGVVYRAHDTRLNRDVALKVLPPAFAEDPSRMARFEREAQLLASLNHPRIAAIYGLEESGTTRALVMELVEGPTLAEGIGRSSGSARPRAGSASPAQAAGSGSGSKKSAAGGGTQSHGHRAALALDEALPIAHQIAEALEYAHEHGIVHRDLKPANIKVTPDGDVKVLDFGLAKAMVSEEGSAEMANSPTLSLAMTEAGFIMGTAAYMAPEQARGKQVDRRADIWAFGCVLYEMLTGQKAFEGETVSDVLASVIRGEPDWSALPGDTPAEVRKLIRHCLAKDPKQRLQAIGDARIAIEEAVSGTDQESAVPSNQAAGSTHSTLLRRGLPWGLGVTAVVFAAATAWLAFAPRPEPSVVRFSVSRPENLVNFGDLSVSPDGHNLAFVGSSGSSQSSLLWVRALDSMSPRPLPGTEDASMPFWSADSRWIGYQANGKLQKIAVSGGPPVTICDVRNLTLPNPDHHTTGSWNRDGVILFSNTGGIYRVPDAGGTPTLVVAQDAARNESGLALPEFLPDGRHFLVEVIANSDGRRIAMGSLDSKSLVDLTPASSHALYASPGYLFYLDQTTLMARPFDARALRFTGPPSPLAQNVGQFTGPDYGYFSVSAAGVLAYQTVPDAGNQMAWFDRSGHNLGIAGQPNIYSSPAISPDGGRLAVAVGEHGKADIWVYDLKRGTASRLTFNPAYDVNPVWSQDGRRILFTSDRRGSWDIYQKAANGLETTQPVFQSAGQNKALDDVTSDGRYALYDTADGSAGTQLWVLPLSGDRKPFPFVQGNFGATSGQFSPNGRYVAYTSNETGRNEVYVQTFPQPTGRWEISTAGGAEPMWRRDGKELFYLAPDEKLMAVDVDTTSAAFQAGIPRELFQTQLVPLSYWRNIYVPSPDGQRFLMITPVGKGKAEPMTVVVNWPAVLKK
ncbi:MAG TPA: protein kinase [Acidobacteriaceae bacterium]|nr:protein kinase [Acidobacteriaceae bacterium]